MNILVRFVRRAGGSVLAHTGLGYARARLRKRAEIIWYRAYGRINQHMATGRVARLRRPGSARQAGKPLDVAMINLTSTPGLPGFPQMAGALMHRALERRGHRVRSFYCAPGMIRCLAGVRGGTTLAAQPCESCTRSRGRMFETESRLTIEQSKGAQETLLARLDGLTIDELLAFEADGLPLGSLCLPSVRRVMRRHFLLDDAITRRVYADFIASAANIAVATRQAFTEWRPKKFVAFNAIFFPEATARRVAQLLDIPTVTYEIGYRPFSLFLSHDLAPSYLLDIPPARKLSDEEGAALDAYLSERFKGRFEMGGLRFWPKMTPISGTLAERQDRYRQMAVVFANTPYDTSMTHADGPFSDMFDWLEATLALARTYRDTLFVVRAHPDEMRYGHPYSREPVVDWLTQRGWDRLDNVVLIGAADSTSSYDLIARASLCVTYNSTIGIEAVALGKPLVCGGRSRYTGTLIADYHDTREHYLTALAEALVAGDASVAEDRVRAARMYLYHMVFEASVDLSPFFEATTVHTRKGTFSGERLRRFDVAALEPGRSDPLDRICAGIVEGSAFAAEPSGVGCG